MKKVLGLVPLAFALYVSGQESQYQKDVSSFKDISKAYYECLSGPIGQQRDFERFRNLFHPNAQFMFSYWSSQENKSKLMVFGFDEYLEKLDYLDKKGFYEEELFSDSQTFGSIAQATSTYRFWMEDKTAEGRGVTFYQYFFDGNRYWIMSMLWQMESGKFPLTQEFLSKE